MFAMNPEQEEEHETPRDRACAMLMGLVVMATGRMVSPDAIASVVDSIVAAAQQPPLMVVEPTQIKKGAKK